MLLFMYKYNQTQFLNRPLCIYSVDRKFVTYPHKKSRIIIQSFFSRKAHNRSLLNYINYIYSNFFISPDFNKFTLVRIVTIYYSSGHPGYLFKMMFVK